MNPHTPQSRRWIVPALALAAPLALLWSLKTGSIATDWATLAQALLPTDEPTAAAQAVRSLRLPRVLAAFAVGGLLSLAGCLMQTLLRNPLADPYVLGVSGGASVVALVAMLAGASGIWITAGAFAGALAITLIVFGLSRQRLDSQTDRLLLTGVAVAATCGAAISLLLTLSPESRVHGMLFWLLGDLSYATQPLAGWLALGIGLIIAHRQARDLNVLARGATVAETLGVDTRRLMVRLYFLTAALTAIAVSLAGSIGFIGLVVPHLLRSAGLTDHRALLAAAVLLGGTLLTTADTLARSLVAPTQLPVGVLTALMGAPLFIYLLNRGRSR